MEEETPPEAPLEAPRKLPWDRILAVVVIALVVVAAIGWLRPVGPAEEVPPEEPENTAPTAVGTVDKTVDDIGKVFTFDGSGSSDPDTGDQVEAWAWGFGDGTFNIERRADGGDGRVTHAYASSGDFVVSLLVEDGRGAVANNDVSLITVAALHPNVPAGNGSAPFAILSADKTVISPGTTVEFDANSSWVWTWDGEKFINDFDGIATYEWFFGDGGSATGRTTTHAFADPGSFAVKLTVSTADDRKDVVIKTIHVLTPGSPFEGVIKNPDSYVFAGIGEPETLDPAKAYDTASGAVLNQVMEQLIWYNKGRVDDLIPWLATDIPTVADGTITNGEKSYKFFIRPNVKFHTGATMTAEDVEYSIERKIVLDPIGGPMWMLKEVLFGAANTSGVFIPYSVIDAAITRNDIEQSVSFHLKEPRADFLQVMAFWIGNVLPKSFAIANGDWDGTAADATAKFESHYTFWDDNLVGTGPYKLVRWDRRQQAILERFDDYWGGNFPDEAKRPANLKTIVFKLVEEFSTRKLLLESGDADVISIDIQFEDQVTGNPDLRIHRGLKGLIASPFLGFNQRINATYAGVWVEQLVADYPEAMDGEFLKWFGDRNVRLALTYAFDVQKFIDDIMRGNAGQLNSPIPEGLLGFNPTSPVPRTFDMALAEQHLKLAWAGPSGSVWDRGFEMDFLYNTGNIGRQAMGDQLKAAIESLNAARTGLPPFTINVRGEPWGSVYLPALFNHGLPAFSLGWIADYADPHNFIQPFADSAGVFAFFMGFDSAAVDSRVDAAIGTTDAATRITLYNEIADLLHDNVTYAFILQSHSFRVERTWVRDWYFQPMGLSYVWAYDKF